MKKFASKLKRYQAAPLSALFFAAVLVLGTGASASAKGLQGSPHDLSAGNVSSPVRADRDPGVCVFCHTPHQTGGELPLWNHALSGATYTPYNSSTIKATVGQPTGASKLCLSCHDGTVALGQVNSHSTPIAMRNGTTTMPLGSANLGTDLSDDHPVSFTYDNTLATADGQLKDPASLLGKVHLDSNKQMQCTSCHDPHDNQFGKFLVQDNTGSAICMNCHNLNLWQNSTHQVSTKTWNGTGINPWPHTSATTVAANACESCHAPHTAGTKARLLTFPQPEQNCYSCHSGTVAAKNVQNEFAKPSVHPILINSAVHDPMEDPINAPRHVVCADCHNPHANTPAVATAPNASGALAGVEGINNSGSLVKPLVAEYQLCFRCHADSNVQKPLTIPRQYSQINKRLAFGSASASFHPVTAMGRTASVPSLISPYTGSSLIYCTDCHNSDDGPGAGGVGARGPHGSIYAPLLERQDTLTDGSPETPLTYALCYKCHNRSVVLSNQSFPGHVSHVVNDNAACSTCHDSHGAPNAHLINFNATYVSANSTNSLFLYSNAGGISTCTLSCHGHDHDHDSYGIADNVRRLPAALAKPGALIPVKR